MEVCRKEVSEFGLQLEAVYLTCAGLQAATNGLQTGAVQPPAAVASVIFVETCMQNLALLQASGGGMQAWQVQPPCGEAVQCGAMSPELSQSTTQQQDLPAAGDLRSASFKA